MTQNQVKELLQKMEEVKRETRMFPRNPAVVLNNWYKSQTGLKVGGCICSDRVRQEIYNTVKNYLENE